MSLQETMLPPMLWDEDTPRTRKSDPHTSHQAADSTTPYQSQEAVVAFMAAYGMRAAFELESMFAGRFSPSRIRTALTELHSQGRVAVVEGVLRETPGGRNARVWAVSS